ncbi:uncharacterized protein LOC101203086 [Cucumis sativus]|nr:uncharacterized protein LOC101203086 [Cucumis sativus]KAE8647966.1 hypothetical protein Csa_000540 [Cucumis sativus]
MNPQNNIIAKVAHVLIHLPRFTPKSLNNCHLPTTFGSPHSLQTSHLWFPPKFFSFGTEKEKEEMGSETFVEIILAILLPPLGVFLRYGCGVEFWICLLLTILGYIPGIIYAIYVLVG